MAEVIEMWFKRQTCMRREIDRCLIYISLNTKSVISETDFPAGHLSGLKEPYVRYGYIVAPPGKCG